MKEIYIYLKRDIYICMEILHVCIAVVPASEESLYLCFLALYISSYIWLLISRLTAIDEEF